MVAFLVMLNRSLFEDVWTKYAVVFCLGAIVAIQDVHQHLFVTVESAENKYKLGGAVHYSLAGKRALFRVRMSILCSHLVLEFWFGLNFCFWHL